MSRLGQPAHAITSLLACSALLLGAAAPSARAEPPAAVAEDAATVPAAEEAAVAPAAPAADAAPDAPPGDETSDTAARADLTGFRERELRAKLAVAQHEEQQTSLLLPWVTTVVGWGLVLAGAAIGVGGVLACDEESCTGPAWPTWLVVGGSLVGAAGTVWLVFETRDLAELRIRRERIERMLEEDRWNRPAAVAPSAALTVSGRF